MKVAIVHDELVRKGGAEQVVLSFHRAFPEAIIHTLSYNPKTTFEEFRSCTIKTSWFGKIIKDETNLKRFFFPFAVMAMKQLHLKGYDVVLMSTTHCSKYVKIDPETLVITYCHTPFRLLWRAEAYEEVLESSSIKKKLYKFVINSLRRLDAKKAARTDWFVTNSREVVPRILFAYHPKNRVSVINPPVKVANFYVSEQVSDYYLIVSRFEPYKKVDLVINAFNSMPERKLLIVGTGSMEQELLKIAGPNVSFLSGLDTEALADVYARCKALIFPQLEDYGITPLEANASGRPVIAYGKGGVLDTQVPVTSRDASQSTALFFTEQTEESIISAINQFEKLSFNPSFIRAHAETYDESAFVNKMRNFVFDKYYSSSTSGTEELLQEGMRKIG